MLDQLKSGVLSSVACNSLLNLTSERDLCSNQDLSSSFHAKFPAETQSRHREQRIANAFRMRMSSREDRTVPIALHASAINYGDIIDLRLWSPTDVGRRTLDRIQFDICFEWKRDVASNCFRGQLEFNARV
ncbi:hypothetical protein CDAR_54561 [Caerostris darwini]|uniref:Uncharacterized protein n=1 Tax=Caerostris darwini TaxID=1538125 RepID=A0AAV4T3K3_9ARAC|nr:hypothetical protein CDAR_54561 [Caerostris darwini]